ncbi:DUF3306 domain-containing protein [Shewanella glacialimarina]|jgi:hypothetical protein|uniref:DUF3306 domain-containing protein n=1 Tax=Shewanella glacialimarina TaxID=2590884 RepID=UPI001CF89E8F|nr:DUF3306 domain-containing protein [Shewanella glacialimarina]UCX03102.1 DUF3306 domain-containing protein [Shewanella glacialimarina]
MSGLLSRWNQRREQVAKEAEQPDIAENESTQVSHQVINAGVASDKSHAAPQNIETALEAEEHLNQADSNINVEDANALSAQELPDPDSIEVGGSFASFMAQNVDPATKAAALKALWKQPQYSHIDGLLEYALDYTNQPKLSAEVSAELAKKIFKHVIEKEESPEDETLETAQFDELNDSSDQETDRVSAETQDISSTDLDNLDANQALVSMEAQSDEQQFHSFTGDAVKVS